MTIPIDAPPAAYTAVRHILTSPLLEARTAAFIGPADFDWPGLLDEARSMSGGERVLVHIAYDLWETEGIVGIWELPRRLGRQHFERVIDALRLYRGDAALPTAA